MPYWSSAVTVKFPAAPAVTGDGKPATRSVLAVAGLTVMPVWLPVMVDVTESVAVSDCAPAVFKVAVKEPVPLVSMELAGGTAWPSVLVKCTVPA